MTTAKINQNNPPATRGCDIVQLNTTTCRIIIQLPNQAAYDSVVAWTGNGSVVSDETGMGYNIPKIEQNQKSPEYLRIEYTYINP